MKYSIENKRKNWGVGRETERERGGWAEYLQVVFKYFYSADTEEQFTINMSGFCGAGKTNYLEREPLMAPFWI